MSGPVPDQESSKWPNRPVYLCAHPQIITANYEPGEALPLGTPIDFESELFKGRIFLRLRSIEPLQNDKEKTKHNDYFEGKKRLCQVVIQGQFKEELQFSDLVMGDFYTRPLRGIPKGPIIKLYQRFMDLILSGVVTDIASDTPKILAPLGGCQILRVDMKGNEPDITGANGIQEDTSLLLGKTFSTPQKRRRYLSNPRNSSKYTVNQAHVYTFEIYDHTMNFGTYYHHIFGNYNIDMAETLNGQPLSFSLFTRDQRILWKFPVWHERLIDDINSHNKCTS
jgi:hypothetical protein